MGTKKKKFLFNQKWRGKRDSLQPRDVTCVAAIVERGINHGDLTTRRGATGNRALQATLTPAKEHPSEKTERAKEGGKEEQRERVEEKLECVH